ncbi:MAG TPA: zinc ribbon domain-containing protein [Bacillota bacterium]|nr:zinc ribbon domain-containing protein [Bacillota bacterium]
MKSIKPGRGPSGMSFIGSVFAVIFGIFWTIMAFAITANAPIGAIRIVFPLFGVIFTVLGIVQAMYHLRNTTGKDRFSTFDITDSTEEKDPLNEWVNNKNQDLEGNDANENQTGTEFNYCPYCGKSLNGDYLFCPKCGKSLK